MASRKLERAAAMVKQSVSRVILYELNDPRMKATITVTTVKVSPELRTAEVFVSMMGTDAEIKTTYRALEHAAGHITSLVGSRLSFRYTPVLRFHLDDSLKKGFAVTQLIDQAMEEIRRKELSEDGRVGPRSSEAAAGKAEEGGDSMERIVDRRERSQTPPQPTEASVRLRVVPTEADQDPQEKPTDDAGTTQDGDEPAPEAAMPPATESDEA